MATLLVIDDDPGFREGLAESLIDLGHRVLAALLAMGIDGIYSDHVDRLVEAVAESQR